MATHTLIRNARVLTLDRDDREFDAANTTEGHKAALARATAAPTFEALVESLRGAQQVVHRAFDEIVAEPAARLAAAKTREIET